jgi:hypothetical protein
MRHPFASASGRVALALGAVAVLLPNALGAQSGGGSLFDRDFMFGKPRASLSFNMGYGMARAGSDRLPGARHAADLGQEGFRLADRR